MLLVSLLSWGVVLLALHLSVRGNPAYVLVSRTPPAVLREAANCLEEEWLPDEGEIHDFLRRFFRLAALVALLYGAEMAVALYFLLAEPDFLLPWFVLLKDLAMLHTQRVLTRRAPEQDRFTVVRALPAWYWRWERISSLLSAVCALVFFLKINRLV